MPARETAGVSTVGMVVVVWEYFARESGQRSPGGGRGWAVPLLLSQSSMGFVVCIGYSPRRPGTLLGARWSAMGIDADGGVVVGHGRATEGAGSCAKSGRAKPRASSRFLTHDTTSTPRAHHPTSTPPQFRSPTRICNILTMAGVSQLVQLRTPGRRR